MPTIYLIRHGQKISTPGDPGLTERGCQQAQETGNFLKKFPISKIISSPSKRAVQTAHQISNILNLEFNTHSSLLERMNWSGQGVSQTEFLREWVRASSDREYIPKYGDSSVATGNRIHNLVTEMAEETEHLVLVTHGGAILDYLRNIFGDEAVQVLRTNYDEGQDFKMYNCAINKVEVAKTFKLELLNFIDHLTFISE